MPKPSRWTAEKRCQIVQEMLRGADRTACQKGSGFRCLIAQMEGTVLQEVALKRPEAGHRKVRVYAVAWQRIAANTVGTSRRVATAR